MRWFLCPIEYTYTFNDFVSAFIADQETVEIDSTASNTNAGIGRISNSCGQGRKLYTEEQKLEASKKCNEKRTAEKQQSSKQTASKRAHIDNSSDYLVFE